jgi:DNA-binding NarL/FixJ family response regulator
MHPLTVVLADDHPILREGVAAFFDEHPDLYIVGQCADGLAAVEMIKTLAPDFAIIDLQLPKLHGLEVIQRLREANSPAKLVVLTLSHDEKMMKWALSAGANGYVVKDGPVLHLFEAIRRIREGGVYVSPLLRRAAGGEF